MPGGDAAIAELSTRGHALEFLKDQYRHCKPILLLGAAAAEPVCKKAGIPAALDSGAAIRALLKSERRSAKPTWAVKAFVDALTQHRHFVPARPIRREV